jgi:hypothetical protein
MRRFLSILTTLLGFATVSHAQAGTIIRPGTYDLQITFGGGTLDGTLVLSQVGDSLGTTLMVGGHDSPVHLARRNGASIVLESDPGISIRYQLEFKGDEVKGTFVYEGQSGSVLGKRRGSPGS